MTAINLPSLGLLGNRRVAPRTTTATDSASRAIAVGAEGSRFLAMGMALMAVLLGAAVAINDGRLHWRGMQWLTLGLLAGACGLLLCRSRGARGVRTKLIERVAAIGALFGLAHVGLCGVQMSAGSNLPAGALYACVSVMGAGIVLAGWTRRLVMGAALLIGGFAVAAFACVWTHPHVTIDVLMFQSESAGALVSGESPYAVRYRDVYGGASDFYGPGVSVNGWLAYSFPYPPASLLLVLPGYLLGDVRLAHAAAMILAGVLIAATGRNRLAVLAAGLLLTSPRSLLVVQSGWTEPLLILLAAATLFCATRGRGLTWVTLGLWFAVKQYMVLVLPLVRLLGPAMGSRRAWRQMVLAGVLLAAAVTIPFAAIEPMGFFRSVVEWQFVQPFRVDALGFPSMLAQMDEAGVVPFGAVGLALLASGAGIALAWWKAPRTPGGLMAASAVVLGLFFAFNKQAFCNYYLLVIGLCCCAIAGLGLGETREPGRMLEGPGRVYSRSSVPAASRRDGR